MVVFVFLALIGLKPDRATIWGKTRVTTALSPQSGGYCPRLHARGSGYFLRAVGPALEASVEH